MMRSMTVLMCSMLVLLGGSACKRMTQRGMLQVTLDTGSSVHFKREVRGQNYDALWISGNDDLCRSADPRYDYVYRAIGPLVVFYRIDGAKLTTYSTTTLDPPSQRTSFLVENHVLQPMDFQELSRTHQSRGLSRAAVEVHGSWRCR